MCFSKAGAREKRSPPFVLLAIQGVGVALSESFKQIKIMQVLLDLVNELLMISELSIGR